MAARVHSNVGLMHATMAMFNAWCDRVPVLVLGATGPVDAAKRRPWIDWIHTARDQGALVRAYTKWDDQPASLAAAHEAILRATWIAQTAPRGPVYVNFDAGLQEMKLSSRLPPIDVTRFCRRVAAAAPAGRCSRRRACSRAPSRPVILAGRGSRSERGLGRSASRSPRRSARVVLTDLKIGASFPDRSSAVCRRRRARSSPDSVEGLTTPMSC